MEATIELITRESIPANDTWDLDGLYASGETWQADFKSLESQMQEYTSFQGTLGESAAKLKACLEFDMEFSRTLEKVHTFAHLRNDEDKTNNLHQGNYEKFSRLLTQYQQARSFINSEIMEIPEATMQGFLDHPELELYKLYLERQLRYRKHTLSKKEEALLAASSEIARAPNNAFDMLDNADLKLGTVKDEEGKEVAITHANLQSLLQKQDRRVRKEAFETFYRAYEDHKFTYSTLLSASIKKNIFYAQARNYSSVREMNLFYEDIPVEVQDQDGSRINVGLPAGLARVAIALAPDSILDEVSTELGPWAPAVRAGWDELENIPDCVLVEIVSGDEHVKIEKSLVVDDDEDILAVTELAAREIGKWEVILARSGEEALHAAREEAPDVILLDAMMPGLDGAATLAKLRQDPATAEIPVIFLTARVQKHEIERYREHGALGVIRKPFDALALPDEVRRLVGA